MSRRRAYPSRTTASTPTQPSHELALHPRRSIDHVHRGRLDPEPAPLQREPVQRPIRHPDTLPGQQLLDLHDRQRVTVAAAVPCQAGGRVSGSGKLGVAGSARARWTSRGRFQDSASCGRTLLNSRRKALARRARIRR